MFTGFEAVVPPAGATVLVSVGTPLVIAVLLAALVAIVAVLVQSALCAPPRRQPAVRVETHERAVAPSRDAA